MRRNAGLNVYVVDDACRGIDINGSIAKAWERHDGRRRQEDQSAISPKSRSVIASERTRALSREVR